MTVAATPAPTQQQTSQPQQSDPATTTQQQVAPQETESWAAKYRQLEQDSGKRLKEHIIERRKWEADRKTTGERLSRLSELEKRESQAKLNPPAFLKSIYGDNWHEIVNESKINGVPPAALVQDALSQMREEFEAKLRARDDGDQRRAQEQQTAALETARNSIRMEAEDFYDASGADYPILERIGDKAAISKTIADRIEKEFHATTRRDESGRVLRQGKVLTVKEATELIENEMLETAEAAFGAEKYKSRFAPKPPTDLTAQKKPESLQRTSQQSGQSQQNSKSQQSGQRKSLSNEITGSTKEEAPVRLTDDERRKRSEAAFRAVLSAKNGASTR